MRLEDIFAKVFEQPADTFDNSFSQDTNAEWTSMRNIALLVAIEEELDIRFSNAEMTTMRSVADIRAALEDHGVTVR
jgi:acyl carrier protein